MHRAVLLLASLLMSVVCLGHGHQHGGQADRAYRGPHHPRGQPMAAGSHQHYRPQRIAEGESGAAPKLTQDADLLHDADHIREDLGDWVSAEDTKKMSNEELEFHYFKLHDFDNNTKLDGLEILQAIHHTLHHEADKNDVHDHTTEAKADREELDPELEQQNFEYFVELIDRVLEEDDMDNDGFLSYVEYVVGRQKDERNRQNKAKHVN